MRISAAFENESDARMVCLKSYPVRAEVLADLEQAGPLPAGPTDFRGLRREGGAERRWPATLGELGAAESHSRTLNYVPGKERLAE